MNEIPWKYTTWVNIRMNYTTLGYDIRNYYTTKEPNGCLVIGNYELPYR